MNERDEQAILRAEAAKQVLENPVFAQSLLAVRAKWFDDLTHTKWFQRRLREDIYRRLKALDAAEKILKNEIASGKLAEDRMKKEKR